MNDQEAMAAINAAMDEWTEGKISEFQFIFKVAIICGKNDIGRPKVEAA